MSGIFDDDTLYSGPTVASLPESDLIEQPGPGIGLAPARMAVPAKVDLRQDAISKMGGLDKLFSASAEIGAALQGKASPLDAKIRQQREERALQLQEFKVKTDSLQDGVKLLENMTGPERDAAAASYAAKLKDIDPDLADTFTLMAKRPDFAKQIMSQYGNSPTIQRMMQADPTGKSVLAFVKTEKGMEHIQKEMDVAALPKLYQKGMSLVANWQQLVPPEMVEKFNKDKIISASELREANAWLKQNNPDVFRVMGLDDDAFAIIGRNEDAYYSALGVLAPKDEQEILKKKGEKALEPGNKTEWIGVPGNRRQQAVIDKDGNIVRMIGSPVDAHAAPVNIYNGGLTAGVDSQGNPVFVQPSGREGVQPRVIEGVRPPEAAAAAKSKRDAETAQNSFQSIDRQITELSALINTAEGKFTSATGIKGFATRAAEVVQGMVNPDAATPALDARNRKELLIARLRKTMADSNMSAKDKEALEAAIGGIESAWGTKASTLRGLNNLRDFVRDRLPKQAAADKFSVGQVYTDANGNRAKYLGNGKWEDQ